MNKVDQFLGNISSDDYDIIGEIKDILFSDKKVHVLVGDGSNGKTSLIHVFKNMLGDKIFQLSHEAVSSALLDNAYIPYIMNCEYIVIDGVTGLINEKIILQLVNGYVCQYHKPYTNNWSQIKMSPKKIIVATNLNPKHIISNQIVPMANIIRFNQVKNPDINLVDDISKNHHKDVYEYLANY